MTVTPRAAHIGSSQLSSDEQKGGAQGSGGLRRAFGRMALALVASAGLLCSAPALAAKYAAIVVDARTGEVLHQENADAIVHPASLTKMMTLYLAFEALDEGRLSLDQALPVSSRAESMSPTKLGVRAGTTLRTEQAVLGLVTKSANDAAVVLAEAMGGSESQFAEMMTRKARQLGMRSTVFRNASGLPNDDQVTTARDFAMLSQALLRDHPKYYPYFSRRNFVYGGRSLHNHNRLMSRYDGMDGIKTGYIRASGFNLAASAVRDGRRLVAVVIGGKSAVSRDNRMAQLLDDAFGVRGRRDDDAPVVAKVEPKKPERKVIAVDEGRKPRVTTAALVPKSPDRKPADEAPKSIAQLAAAASAEPRRGGASAAVDGSGWGVQVGAFASRASGQKALSDASKRAPRALNGAKQSLVEVGTAKGKVFRARLTGLDEKEARDACAQLQKGGQRCVVVQGAERL